jgi:hypothetical protein
MHDTQLDELFAAARSEQPDTAAREAHFETRFMARLAERRNSAVPWHLMVWRMIPAFAVLCLIILVFSFALNPMGTDDLFAAITSGSEDLMARNYLAGE